MKRSLVTALALLLPALSAAEDAGYLTGWLPPRPQMEDYQDREAFVADILRWQRERNELAARAARGELPPLPEESAAEHDPDDWHVITGPEDLDVAVQKAYGYQQPAYEEPLRFNRTTHISFPLESLPLEDMAENAVNGVLGTPDHAPAARPAELSERLLEDLEEITRLPGTPDSPLPTLTQSGR